MKSQHDSLPSSCSALIAQPSRSGITGTVALADGRYLGYAEYGDPGGWPLVFFHGTPGSRVLARLAAAQARLAGIRLLAPERPGYGLSTPQPGRRLLDWPDDVRQWADALGLDRFAVLGVSGGGPYAAACAWQLPDRVSVAGIVSSLAPKDAMLSSLPRLQQCLAQLVRHTWLTGPALTLLAALARRWPANLITVLAWSLPPADRAILAQPDVQQLHLDSLMEAFRQGSQATAAELALFSRPWGFSVAAVQVPVFLWHGIADRLLPVAMGRYLANQIPDCQARFLPDAGHLWIFQGYLEVLATLRRSAR